MTTSNLSSDPATIPEPLRYSKITSALHWLALPLILGLLASGGMMGDMQGPERLELLDIHRKIGLLTGLVFIVRIVFFFLHARPRSDPAWPPLQAKIAKLVHAFLYLLPLIMVGSGMAAMVIFGLVSFIDSGDIAGYLEAHRVPPMLVHSIAAKLLVAAILLHVLGGLYHHFVQKDGIFSRIWFGS